MDAGELMAIYDLEKLAISDELKYKASVERTSRNMAKKKLDSEGIPHKIRVTGNQPESSKKVLNDAIAGGQGPLFKYVDHTSKRTDELVSSYKPKTTTTSPPISSTRKKKLGVKSVRNGLLLAGGLAGATYGGKKLYDHFNKKPDPSQPHMADKYEAQSMTTHNASPHLRSAKMNKTAQEKIALSPELMQRALVERSARNLASNPTLQSNYAQSGINVRAGDSRMNTLLPGRANATVQAAAPVRGRDPFAASKNVNAPSVTGTRLTNTMAQMPDAGKLIGERATQIRQNALGGKPITPPNQTLSSFVNKPKPTGVGSTMSKALSNPLTKKIGIGAGLVGAGMLAGNALSGPSQPQMQKMSSLAVAGLENLGLGVLAAPSISTLRDPHATEKEKSHAKYETAGLGVLAAHPTYEMAQALAEKLAPSMMQSKSPIMQSVGQQFQQGHLGGGIRQGFSGMVNKFRPMMKLSHTAFYREMVKAL